MIEHDRTAGAHESGPEQSAEDMVESAGETTAAATGPAERGAMTGEPGTAGAVNTRPVGADTMVRVADEGNATEEHS
jgi:hypothetical protein